MGMRLLYPSDPTSPKAVDETYAAEFEAACSAGFRTSIFSVEDFELGVFRPKPGLEDGETVLYRGWMLSVPRYDLLTQVIKDKGAKAFTSTGEYQLCHHLPMWHATVSEFTADTVVLARNADFVEALAALNWPGYFVKDYVKSLNTAGGSLVATPGEVAAVVSLLEKYRGVVEGGVCVRKREDFIAGSERRSFVFKGQPFAIQGEVPFVVAECAKRIPSPFFSVDTAIRSDGVVRVVELGDGQVSDIKEWDAAAFVKVLGS